MVQYDRIFGGLIKMKEIKEAIVYIENSAGDFSYKSFYGDKDLITKFVLSGVSKMFTTACVLQLITNQKMLLTEQVSKYLGDKINGLLIYKGVDYTKSLTIEHLLSQTSGFPDYFESFVKSKTQKEDFLYSFEEVVAWTKKLKCVGKPGDIAYYSDFNFDLLGQILEAYFNKPLSTIYKEMIFDPLQLTNTYLPRDVTQIMPNIFYNDKYLSRPKLLMSRRASGGCVTNAKELMIFTKAFFQGKLFNKELLNRSKYRELQPSIMAPANYGLGYMQVVVPKLEMDGYVGKGDLFGQSSTTGAFAFYCPQTDLFLVGDINQMGNPGIAKKIAILLASCR